MTAKIFADQCRYILWFADPMLVDLNDSHLTLEPVAGNKSAGWILGHLAVSGDFGRRICGRPPICPKEWRALFSPGTRASDDDRTAYPHMVGLIKEFKAVYADLPDAFLGADASVLSSPNPFEPAREGFPTVGEFLPWLVSGHLAYHIAQLGDWRRAAGLGHKSHI